MAKDLAPGREMPGESAFEHVAFEALSVDDDESTITLKPNRCKKQSMQTTREKNQCARNIFFCTVWVHEKSRMYATIPNPNTTGDSGKLVN